MKSPLSLSPTSTAHARALSAAAIFALGAGALVLAAWLFQPADLDRALIGPLAGVTFLLAGLALFVAERRSEARHRAGEEVRERFLSIVDSTDDAIVGKDLDGTITSWNRGAEAIFGWTAAEVVGRSITTIIPPERQAEENDILARLVQGERVQHLVTERMRKDDARIRISATISPIRDRDGRVTGASKIARDITEQQRSAEALRTVHTQLQHLFTHGPAILYSLRIENGSFFPVMVSDNITRILGYTVEEAQSHEWWAISLHPDDRDRALENAAQMVERGGYTTEYRIRHRDGTYRWFQDSNRTIRTGPGGSAEAVGVWLDVTDRKAATDSLEQSEERFRQLTENIREVFWMIDASKNEMLYVSPAYERIWKRTCRSLYEEPRTWLDAIHPDDRDRVISAAETKQAQGDYDEEYRINTPDGEVRWIHDRAVPIRDAAGRVYRVAGVAEDVTARRRLEDQLRQSQKMEAIGQLAGGVAHDFNNLLCVITGHCGLMTLHEDYAPSLDSSVTAIQTAADRAATLTRQLLAFSRRQTILPRDVDLNGVLSDITKMTQRLIGENISIELHFASQPLVVHADGGMLDQVILNLAVNARDAMPDGGRLILETSVADLEEGDEPSGRTGSFVCLTVSDTGTGIAKDVLPRIFEPFFTTKEVGRGTGLGLATVYGIIDQHRGWVTVYSEVGFGTTFRVYLPRIARPAEVSVRPDSAKMPRGDETILVAEDEANVRQLVRMVLTGLGYEVLDCATGVEALELWALHRARVKLLVTDLMMPDGLSGMELVEKMRADGADLRVLYMSGYSPEIAGRWIQLKEGANFLSKPFPPQRLACTVRDTLDLRTPVAPAAPTAAAA